MTSCTIIISHYESLPFLHACIRQIRKYKHPEIYQVIYIIDQSSKETFAEIDKQYGGDDDIELVLVAPLYSGYGIDWAMRFGDVYSEYVCQIHSDVVPLSPQWLYLPIKLIEENNFSFVGQLQFVNINSSIYPPNPFFAMAQCYNVARTETYREMSLEAGFTRFHNRPQSGLTFLNDDWSRWASDDYENKGSDDDTVAFSWEDKYRQHDKLGLAISGYISPAYGRIIDSLVFHFCSCRESVGVDMGEQYNAFTQRINQNYSDSLIEEMLNLAKQNKPPHMEILTRNVWDGKLKKSFPSTPELDKRIEELKNG